MTSHSNVLWNCIQPYILVGGLSKRFGSDKSLALIESETQIDRLWNAIAADFSQAPILIQRANAGPSLLKKYPSIEDKIPSRGPLCGIAAGLAELQQRKLSKDSLALFVPCDLFEWSRQVIANLAQAKAVNNQAEVVVYETANGIEPFPSVWDFGLADDVLAAATSEDRSIIKFIQNRNFCAVPLKDSLQIASFNTPEQLAELQRRRS